MNIPEPEVVLRKLAHLLPIIYSSLQHGTHEARDFFDGQKDTAKKVLDRYLAPNLVRFHARHLLKKNDVSVVDVSNNGMCFAYDGYIIRILKANNGKLPVPGHSETRRAFYQQDQYKLKLVGFDNSDDNAAEKLNLIILWDVSYSYDLGVISLACPKSGDFTRESVSAYWHCKIPASMLLGQTSDNIPIESLDIEDLPISLDTDQISSTGDFID
jgi:hypothetical protein